ncbi:hypothetical protein ABZP36_033190 [Zizania latifolia]
MSSSLSMVEARLPPGFRFHPRDDELVLDYLSKKLGGGGGFPELIDVDLNKCEPWDLPGTACIGGKEWYLYSLKDRKYATGQRANRATESGYWKATGKDREITRQRSLVGMRKTLVFYTGRAPMGTRTDWVMHEFRREGHGDRRHLKEDWVLCRVFYKSRTSAVAAPRTETTTTTTTTCYINGATARAPLPAPLVDHSISFDLADDDDEPQVPCFFSSSHDEPSPSMKKNVPAARHDQLHEHEGQAPQHAETKATRDVVNQIQQKTDTCTDVPVPVSFS